MTLHTLSRYLLVSWCCATAALAAPLASPLAVTPDVIGADLQSHFIAAPAALNGVNNGFVAYRKQFTLTAAPASVQLHLFADTRYVLWINGVPVHRGPNRFETRGPQYDTVEIASKLVVGVNTLAIVVMGNTNNARMMQHAPGLTLRIDAGNTTVVRTDTSWLCSNQTRYRPAEVTWPDIIDRIDTRFEDGDWTLSSYNSNAWSAAVTLSGDSWGPLAARRTALLRDTPVAHTFSGGVTLPTTLTSGQQINLSTGRMVQAYTILDIETTANTQITLNYAGGITYFAKAGRQTYVSSDSYAFIDGAITVNSGQATIHSIQFIERLYPFDVTGSFNSSDPILNKLWGVCTRSGQILSEDAYVDCADRERAEWMDCDPPAFDVTRTALSAPGPDGQPVHSDPRLLGEMLRRTALSLQPDGWVKAHTSSDRYDIHAKMEDRACDWIQGARRYYDSSGDPALIREIWPTIVTQLNYFLARRTVRGLVRAREWVVWGNPVGYLTCEGTGLNAFVYKALIDANYLGLAINKNAEAATFSQAATDLAAAMNNVLWDETRGNYSAGYYTTADQAAPENQPSAGNPFLSNPPPVVNEKFLPSMFSALWMLDQGVVPAARKARVTAYLLANRAEAQRIMTFYYLYYQLYQQHTTAFDTEILQAFRTKWSGMANSRYQTTWEDFVPGNTVAHIYGMFPSYFLSAYTLGVRVDGLPTAKKLLIEPRPGDLIFAAGKVVTELGVIPISWKRQLGGLEVTCTIPLGSTATLRIPRLDTTLPPSATLNGQKLTSIVTDGRYVVVPVTAGTHILAVSSDLTWQGGGTNLWNISTSNWLDAAATPTAFRPGVNVIFDDSGSNSSAISLTGLTEPTGVTVHSTKNFTLTGPGSLSGSMRLTKAGAGTLTLASNHSYSGGVALDGGVLSLASGSALGTGPVIFNGGRLAFTADTVLTNPHTVSGSSSAEIDTASHSITLQADTTSLKNATGGLTKLGTGTYTISANQSYTGPTRIEAGTLKLGPKTAMPNIAGLIYQLDASNPSSMTLTGSKLSSWRTITSGSSVSFDQATSVLQPTLIPAALNGKSVVRFSGAQRLVLAQNTQPQEVVAITTVKGGVDGNIGGFLGAVDSDNGFRLNSSPASWAADGTVTEVNGTQTSNIPAPYTPDQAQVVHRYQTSWGAWPSTGLGQYFYNTTERFYNGDLAELLVYSSTLTPADRLSLRTYLGEKWLGYPSTTTTATLSSSTSMTLTTGGCSWDLNGAHQTITTLTGVANTSVLLGNGSLTLTGSADTEFAGAFSGTGSITKSGTGILTLSGSSSIGGNYTNSGTTVIRGGSLNVQGTTTNNGTMRLIAGASLGSSGTLINHGVLDMMTGSQILPANLVNHGTVLTSSAVKVNSIEMQNGSVTLKITGYAGHGYQLQTSSDFGTTPWVNLDGPQLGAGQELTFSINSIPAVPHYFYRIAVAP